MVVGCADGLLKVTTKVPLTGPFSAPFVPALMLAIEVSSSAIFTVAGVALAVIAALLVAACMVKTTVSIPSAMLSSITGTVTVAVVCPAGMVTVVPIAV
ncbi:hypothetical protein D3C87_716070 [compost metagenome]